MIRWRRTILAVAALLVAAGSAGAQSPSGDAPVEPAATAPAPAATTAPAPATTAPAATDQAQALPDGIDRATLDRVIGVLEDEQSRKELLDTLRTLTAMEAPSAAPRLVAGPMEWLREKLDQRAEMLLETFDAVVASLDNIGQFQNWVDEQVSSPLRRAFWLRTFRELGLILGAGLIAALATQRLLRGTRARVGAYLPPTPFHLAGGLLLNLAVRLLPISLFVAAAYGMSIYLNLGSYARAVAAALVTGFAFVTAVTAVIRAIVNHENARLSLVSLAPDTAATLERGLIRIVAVGGYGYFSLEAARALGLPWTLHGFLLHLLFISTLLIYVRLVLRFRAQGAERFNALAQAGGGVLGRFLPWHRVGAVWHWGAILFGLAIYGAWALQVPGGPGFLLRAMGLTLAILVLSRLIVVWLAERGRVRQEQRVGEEREEGDLSEIVSAAAASPMTVVWRLLTVAVSLVLILEVWGIDVVGLLDTGVGQTLRSAAANIAVALALAYVLWKLVSGFTRGAIDEKDALGRPVLSNRARTLLTISRNLAFVMIWLTAGLMSLGELGVNLAPLLAGAGVIGLAVGFGSQQLVRDIITGFFILLEDIISVGDVAELAGRSGVVEAVSLRTVRLRAYDGQVHTIPYSSIDTISNFTKDFSFYVFDVGIAYHEDTDKVVEVMREIGAEMQRERAYRRLILEPIDIAGVDRFDDSAVVIRARIKTRPLQQWTVGREFNRRLKKRFDSVGIEFPFPQLTLHVASAGPFAAAAPAAVSGRSAG